MKRGLATFLLPLIATYGCASSSGILPQNTRGQSDKSVDTIIKRVEGKSLRDLALNYVTETIAQEGVIPHPGESAAADMAIRDFRSGKIDAKTLTRMLKPYSENIQHPGESAAYNNALRDLKK